MRGLAYDSALEMRYMTELHLARNFKGRFPATPTSLKSTTFFLNPWTIVSDLIGA